ncbi:MAG TPA: hypothetical protein VLM85_01960, partial [Polyangiaceae bacterium]|nr:hypothetical protein [Polyangiaceae bacterium]
KALMTVEVIGKQLDPDLDVFGEAQPYFLDLLRKRYSPDRLGMELWRGVEQLSRAGWEMPIQLREVLDDLRSGRLTVRMADPAMPFAVDRIGRRLFSGIVSAGLFLAGAHLLSSTRHPALGWTLVASGAVLIVLHWMADSLRKPKA